MRPAVAFAALLLMCAAAAPSTQAAERCNPVSIVASIPTETDASAFMLVPASFSGTRKLLLVDTGGVFHELRPSVVRELGLITRKNQVVIVVDALGGRTDIVANAPQFSVGPLIPASVDFLLTANEGLLGTNGNIAGIFAPAAYYRTHDIDFDFAGRKLNLVSQDHCEGKVVYWPNNGVAVVPFNYDLANHILFNVKVDGAELRAKLDTGSSHTFMYTRVARRLGVDESRARDVGALGNNPNVRMYEHRFKRLSIEGITIDNPHMMLIPDMNTKMPQGPSTRGGNDTRFAAPRTPPGPDILIGMSTLRRLHVYVATKERKLYITDDGLPDVPTQPSAAAVRTVEPTASGTGAGNERPLEKPLQ